MQDYQDPLLVITEEEGYPETRDVGSLEGEGVQYLDGDLLYVRTNILGVEGGQDLDNMRHMINEHHEEGMMVEPEYVWRDLNSGWENGELDQHLNYPITRSHEEE